MAPDEMKKILALAAAHDGRTWPDDAGFLAMARAWYECAGADDWLTFELARQAVYEHYRAETRRIMPADIRNRALEIRHQRLQRTELPDGVLDELAEAMTVSGAAYRAVLAAAEDAIVAGAGPDGAVAAAKLAGRGGLRAIDRERS